MSSLSTNFSQFIDLTINPSHGTINTTRLHALLHLIVDQLRLSSSFIEFHGIGCGAASSHGNQISPDDNQQRCRVEVKQFEIKQEIDGDSTRKEVNDAMPEALKVFAIRKVDCIDSPPLNSIQSISIEQFKMHEMKVNSIHELMTKALPADSSIIKEEDEASGGVQNSMKTLIDLVNATKRIDALEIVARQMAGLLKEIQCEEIERKNVEKEIRAKIANLEPLTSHIQEQIESQSKNIFDKDEIIDGMQAELKAFRVKLTDCQNSLDTFQCKCDKADFEAELFNRFRDRISVEFLDLLTSSTKNEIENLRSAEFDEREKLTSEMAELKESICEQFKTYERDLVKCMQEIQEMLNAKFNKCDVVELRKILTDELSKLDEKIEKVECKRAIAAGVTKKIFKDINCVSCGDKVIQIDDVAPPPLIKSVKHNMKLPKRSCGGKHTIMRASERVFRVVTGNNCQK